MHVADQRRLVANSGPRSHVFPTVGRSSPGVHRSILSERCVRVGEATIAGTLLAEKQTREQASAASN